MPGARPESEMPFPPGLGMHNHDLQACILLFEPAWPVETHTVLRVLPPTAPATVAPWGGWVMTCAAPAYSTARKHLQIQHAVAAVLPPALGALCVVAKLENQHLQLAVPGPAYAAKLRQMAPRIAQTLTGQGWNVNEISVRVQAGMPRPGQKRHARPSWPSPWASTALDAFETLHRGLRPALADASGAAAETHHKNR